MEGIGDVIGHIAGRMRQNNDHMGAGGDRGSQSVCLGLDK